jgi:diadenosine tetraphosphatase ApaH/serine/threonine PP2A family protein phosphatase
MISLLSTLNPGDPVVIALLSDIHSNIEALEACLRHARENGAERFAFLGDLVGYGADPQAVVDLIEKYAAEGSVVVKGNHDAAVEASDAYMNEDAAEAISWTRGALSDRGKAFLAQLPLCVKDGAVCYVHASADNPAEWPYVDGLEAAVASIVAAQTAYTFSGHVHDQALYFLLPTGKISLFRPTPGSPVPVPPHRRWLAIVGSVGQPRDRNPAAAYALFDEAKATITFHRIPYDNAAAARKIRAAGLPESLAWRLETGR